MGIGHVRASSTSGALVDAHVHLHDCFNDESFFEHAERNMGGAAARMGVESPTCVLLLTEPSGADHFARLARRRCVGRRDLSIMGEGESLLVAGPSMNLVLVAGRQIATSDGLELLALGTRERFEDGKTLAEALRRVLGTGALAVVPWGFGKWWLKRGSLVRKILKTGELDGLGDNGGRTWLFREPRNFRVARKMAVRILPGSDPLPFPAEVRRVGSYGFWLEAPLSLHTPAADLRRAVRDRAVRISPFGSRRAPAPFLWTQVRMQLSRRLSIA